jgi:uncharacterized protein (DUF58 family)
MIGVVIAIGLLAAVYGLSWLQMVIYRRHWNKNLVYSLHSSKNAAFEGERVTLTDRLSNGKWLPLPWVHVGYRLSRHLVFLDNVNKKISRGERRNLLYIVGMKKAVSQKSTVLCNKRGYYTAASLSINCNNLFMTNYVDEKPDFYFGMLVYPRIVDYPESVIPLNKILGDVSVRRFINPDPFTFKGLREYQPYDSSRQVNWNATARAGTLMSNVHDFTVSQDITVLLDLQDCRMYNRDYVHEEAIRVAAFVCRKCIAVGIPVSLVCPDAEGSIKQINSGLSKAHLEAIYTALAYIDLNAYNRTVTEHIPKSSYILISSLSEQCRVEITSGSDVYTMEVRDDAED